MAIIYSYPPAVPKLIDKIIITQSYDANDEEPIEGNPTRTALISDIVDLTGVTSGTANTLPIFTGTGLGNSVIRQDSIGIVYIGPEDNVRFTGTSVNAPNLVGTDLYITNIYGSNGGLLNIQGNSTIGNAVTDTLTVNSVSTFNANVTVGSKVGIGTPTPLAALDVKETTSDVPGQIIVGGLIDADDKAFGKLCFANTAAANSQPNKILASIEGRKNGSSNRGILTFGVADGSGSNWEKMRIDSYGRVGIQTDTPDRELDVNGGVRIRHTLDLFQGNNNSFAGQDAGNLFNIVAGSNTGFGKNSQLVNVSGSSNTSMGLASLGALVTGNSNTAIGTNSMLLLNGGSQNVALGSNSLVSATTGNGNTAIGHNALQNKTTTNFNTAVGNESLNAVTTGFRNTAIGNEAGRLTTTGSYNTSIGDEATPTTLSASNEVTLGGSSVTVLRCAVTSITSLSDERDKTDISELEYGLDFVNSLSAKKWTWNQRSEYRDEIDEDGNKVQVEIENSNRGKIDFGFIAQEVQSVDNELLRLVYDSNPEKLEMSYGKLVPILVKAIQELKAEVEILKAK